MKRTFKSILFVAAAAMAFTACNVEIPEEPAGTHTVKFIASQVDTKTTMDIKDGVASFAWEDTDKANFHIFENGVGVTGDDIYAEIIEGVMNISAVFPDSSAPYTYTGFMAATVSNGNPAVGNEQIDLGAYAPESDILVAKPVTDKTPDDILEGILFQFKRVVAINQMTLKGLTAGETVTDVTIASDKAIAGEYDFANGSWNASETSISITTESVANADGQAVVYFVCAPVEAAQLTITATTTEGKTYSKELAKTITFTEGGVKFFGVTVSVPVEPAYVKVTSTTDLTDGKYLIVCEDQNVAFNGALEALDAVSNTVAVTISDGEIASSTEIDAAAFTFTAKDGSFLSGSGKYIGNSENSNALNTSTSLLSNSVYITDGDAYIIGDGGAYLRYNAASNQTRFRYYKSSTYTAQKAIQLYKFNGTPAPEKQSQTLIFPQESYEVIFGETFTAPTVSGAQTTVTYNSSNVEVATVDASTGAVQILSAGEVTITATAEADDTYEQGTASYTITIIDPSAGALTTIEQIFTSSDVAGNYKVIFNNWVVSGVKGSNVYVTDGTNGFIIYYKSGHGFEVGDILSGTVNSCALTRYNGSAEFTNITKDTPGLTVTKGGTIDPVTISIANLSGQNTGAVITFDSLKYNGSEFSDGVNTIKPYNTFDITLPTLTSGRDYQVTGVFIQFNDTKEIAPRSNDDIVLLVSPYLTASANKTTGISADGETITITVDTNVEGWTVVSSDNVAFAVGEKSGNAVSVLVSANESVTDSRTANITVSAEGVESVVITLTQDAKSGGGQGGGSTTAKFIYSNIYSSVTSGSKSLDGLTDTVDGVSIKYVKVSGSNSPQYYANGSNLRIYNESTMTVTVPDGKLITEIAAVGTTTWASGKMSADSGIVDDNNKKWTGSASTVVITITGSFRFVELDVTYSN